MDWINRLGILLTFISFWFAAPELIGEKRLRLWENKVSNGLEGIPHFIANTMLVVLLFGAILIVPWFFGIPLIRLSDMNFFQNFAGFIVFILGLAIATWIVDRLENALSIPFSRILHWLADEEQTRRRSLILGAWLFVTGSILQFWATFG
jgi:hypothetical protein